MENNITHINQYCLEHSNQESDLLKEIREYTYKTEEAAMMITGPIVANFLKNIIRLKKFMGREYMGIFRITYVIDENGKIINVYPKVNTKTHAQDILCDFK